MGLGKNDVQDDKPVTTRDLVEPISLSNKGKYIKLISWNVNSLNSLINHKLSVLRKLISDHKPDVLIVQVSVLNFLNSFLIIVLSILIGDKD